MDIHPRAKGFAGPREHDRPHPFLLVQIAQGFYELSDYFAAQGVPSLRAIEHDCADGAGDFHIYRAIGH
jgi:hypothetical protein